MSVAVRLVGDLQRFAEPEPLETGGAGWTLGTALDELARLYPRLGRELFDDHRRLHYAVVIMVSGRRVTWPDGRDTLIEDGGELMLTRFHAGG